MNTSNTSSAKGSSNARIVATVMILRVPPWSRAGSSVGTVDVGLDRIVAGSPIRDPGRHLPDFPAGP